MDAIASCAFGVDAESFGAEESKFVKSAKDIFRSEMFQNSRCNVFES